MVGWRDSQISNVKDHGLREQSLRCGWSWHLYFQCPGDGSGSPGMWA